MSEGSKLWTVCSSLILDLRSTTVPAAWDCCPLCFMPMKKESSFFSILLHFLEHWSLLCNCCLHRTSVTRLLRSCDPKQKLRNMLTSPQAAHPLVLQFGSSLRDLWKNSEKKWDLKTPWSGVRHCPLVRQSPPNPKLTAVNSSKLLK